MVTNCALLRNFRGHHKYTVGSFTPAEIPSWLMLSGMRWIFCSLTQLLVNICSSTDVSEAGFTPEDKMTTVNKNFQAWRRLSSHRKLTFLLLLLDHVPPFSTLIIGGNQEAVTLNTKQGPSSVEEQQVSHEVPSRVFEYRKNTLEAAVPQRARARPSKSASWQNSSPNNSHCADDHLTLYYTQ